MDKEPLVDEQIEAGSRFLHEFEKFAPIKCAAWLNESDSGRWYLYIISDSITDKSVATAYGQVLQIARTMTRPQIDPFRVRVIAANANAARRVMEIQQRYSSGTTPAPWQVPGSLGVEDAYVYELPITVHGA